MQPRNDKLKILIRVAIVVYINFVLNLSLTCGVVVYMYRGLNVNSLLPNDAIWRHDLYELSISL